MGGMGSGRGSRMKAWRSKKLKTTSLPGLCIPELIKLHKSNPNNTFTFHNIRLTVADKLVFLESLGSEKMFANTINVAAMPCNYGGFRYFGLCQACHKQAATLYFHRDIFACRRCFKMAYCTQNYTLSYRLLLKRRKAKEKINNNEWVKPKWMWKTTFARLRSEYFALDEKEQIADFFSLRSNREVDRIFNRYGSVLVAAEAWGMHYFGDHDIPMDKLKEIGCDWD